MRIRSYIRSQNIKVSKQSGIHKRIIHYLKKSEGNFSILYPLACAAQTLPESQFHSRLCSYWCKFWLTYTPGHPPTTTADSPWSLEFNVTTWDGIESLFSKSVADAIPKRDASTTDGVRAKLSRTHSEDDMIISLAVAPETSWRPTLFPDGAACFDNINVVFGPIIAEAIEHSQLRNWEREKKIEDQTRCVEMARIVRLRLASRLDIANAMYSIGCDSSSN